MRLLKWILLTAFIAAVSDVAQAEIKRKKFTAGGSYLIVEVLDDDLVHCELSAVGAGPAITSPIYSSPMVLKTDYAGPSTYSESGNVLETSDLRIEVDPSNLCVKYLDKKKGNAQLTSVCPRDLNQAQKGLNIDPAGVQHVYGLGQKFKMEGSADGDWLSFGIRDGAKFGNGFEGFGGGAVGNVQIPVMYAVGANTNYALFFDNVYRQGWDFQKFWWEVTTFGDQLRYYIMAGADLPDLRQDYMQLTGRPPVPPRKAFGLWVSEFGYDNWGQIDQLKTEMRNERFPLDGFVLDLNWFGGVNLADPSKGQMGRLNWDEVNDTMNPYFFDHPKAHVEDYAKDQIGLTVIEESYLAKTCDTFNDMPEEYSSYARRSDGACDTATQTTPIADVKGFWGEGRMIDWSDPAAGQYIHDERRFPNLVMNGVTSHWTDLGEPEVYNDAGCYEGVEATATGRKTEHSDIHNVYNLLWNKSIWDGYFDKRGGPSALGLTAPRPFIVTRSGTAGTQRYGVAMWSGDIASHLGSLATHANAQVHMSFSGIDFYGADIGGFRREALPYNDKSGSYRNYEGETYTQWFANGCWFDVPVRPHTDNEFITVTPEYETAPHLVGKKKSNLENLRQRYELIPYYYSLAYRAHLFGEPLCPPLAMYYQNDPQVRRIGHEKLIGRDLLVGIVARYGEYERDVYLPAGKWVNYHTREWFDSKGETVRSVPTYRDGLFRLPAFARAGSILPLMLVDENTKDAFGTRTNGDHANETMIVQVCADAAASSFTLYEDDGIRLQYETDGRPKYRHRTTEIKQQQLDADTTRVRIESAVDVNGTEEIEGVVGTRHHVVRLIVNDMKGISATLNGTALAEQSSAAAFQAADSGWFNASRNLILAKSPQINVNTAKELVFELASIPPATSVNFVCDNGVTTPGVSIYVVGDIPELGGFDASKAIKLDPNVYYEYIVHPPVRNFGPGPSAPVWTGVISELPANKTFQWKCIRKREDGTGSVEYEPGPNHVHTTGPSGYAGRAFGSF